MHFEEGEGIVIDDNSFERREAIRRRGVIKLGVPDTVRNSYGFSWCVDLLSSIDRDII